MNGHRPEIRWSALWVLGGYLGANFAASFAAALFAGAGGSGLGLRLVGVLGLWVGFVGGPVFAARSQGTGSVTVDFGLHTRWVDVPVGVFTGVGLQLAVLPVVYLGIELVTGPLDLDAPASELAETARGPIGWLLLAAVVGVGSPVAEELFFRGLLQQTLRSRWGPTIGVAASSALFAATHFQAAQFTGLFIAGLAWALLAERFERLGAAVLSHMAFNLSTVAALYLAA